jgi:hypothetical protein
MERDPEAMRAVRGAYPTNADYLIGQADRLHKRSARTVEWADCLHQAVLEHEAARNGVVEWTEVAPASAGYGPVMRAEIVDYGRPAPAAPTIDTLSTEAGAGQRARRLLRRYRKLMRLADADQQERPSEIEAAKLLGVSFEDLDRLLAFAQPAVRLDEEILDDEGATTTRHESIPDDDESATRPDLRVIRQQERDRTHELLGLLSAVERAAVLGLDRPGVSRQAEHKAKGRGFEKLVAMAKARGWYEEPELFEPTKWSGPYTDRPHRGGQRLHLYDHPGPEDELAARMAGDRGAWT